MVQAKWRRGYIYAFEIEMIGLFDAAFPTVASMSAKGENLDLKPKHFEWQRNCNNCHTAFFTDSCLGQVDDVEAKIKVAWLLEPPPFRQNTYDYVLKNQDKFDYILTYKADLIDGKKFLFYPYGGSMIKEWSLPEKTRLVSMVISPKQEATGHKLRYEIVKQFGSRIDVFGLDGYVSKRETLENYMFQIVVMGERLDYCFDEKIIDCFALGVVPIFWGCPRIYKFFTINGISLIIVKNL